MGKLNLGGGQLAEVKVMATGPTRGDLSPEDKAKRLSHHPETQKGQQDQDTPATLGSGQALGAYR